MNLPTRIEAPVVIEIKDILSMYSNSRIIEEMANTYPLLGGDRYFILQKDTCSDMELVINEKLKERLFRYDRLSNEDNILSYEVMHRYNVTEYHLAVRMYLCYVCKCTFDFVLETDPARHKVVDAILLVGKMMIHDLLLPVTNPPAFYEEKAEMGMLHEEYDIEPETIKELEKDVKQFKKQFCKGWKATKSSRLARLMKARQSLKNQLAPQERSILDNAIELFTICADPELSNKMLKAINFDNWEEGEVTPLGLFSFIGLQRYSSMEDWWWNELEGYNQSGCAEPVIEVSIQTKEDVEGLIGISRYFTLLKDLFCAIDKLSGNNN
ncbi:MAG: hypothetical protein WCQ90_00500 [Deltaproteobacteria bacterium]